MKKLIALVLVCMFALTALPFASAESGYTIGLSLDAVDSGFWIANFGALYDKAEELGVTVIETVAGGDANLQNQQVSDLIAKGCQAIIIAAADSTAIEVAIQECKDAGVYCIMNNRPVVGETLPDAQVVADNYQMAYDEMTWLINYATEQGITFDNCIMLIGSLGDENAVQRYNGYMDAINDNPGVVTVAVEINTEWDLEVCLSGLQNALQAVPDADLIVMPSDSQWTPVQSALEQVGKWAKIGEENHVACISFDGDSLGMQMMKDGYSWADAAQGASYEGALCVEIAVQLIEGETLEDVNVIDPGIICNLENFDEVKETVWSWSEVK